MNIMYIRAAIEAATGVRLDLKDVRKYLIEEGLITRSQAKNLIFPGYSVFHDGVAAPIKKNVAIPPVDKIIKD